MEGPVTNMIATSDSCFLLADFIKSSPLNLLSQMNMGNNKITELEKTIVRNRPIRNKNCPWRPCLSTDRDDMSNLYRRPSIVASYQVSVFIVSSFSEIMVFYKDCSYHPDPLTNIVATDNSCFWLADFSLTHLTPPLTHSSTTHSLISIEWWWSEWEIGQSETRIVRGDHVCQRIGMIWAIFIEDLP
jgi:hypothetical protein